MSARMELVQACTGSLDKNNEKSAYLNNENSLNLEYRSRIRPTVIGNESFKIHQGVPKK